MMNVNGIRSAFANTKITANGTLEIPFAQFEADEPTIFGKPNEDWHRRELDWYLGQSLNVYDIEEPIPELWKQVAAKDGTINSNYGWCIFSKGNGHQFHKAVNAIYRDPNTRQAVMIYTRPSMHEDAVANGRYDFMCTNTVQLLLRNGVLDYGVFMRSSDAIFGYKGDRAWHNWVFDECVGVLNCFHDFMEVKKGRLIWNAASFHIYPKHIPLVEKYWETGEIW